MGHSGAMALFWRRATRQVELLNIHRFKDPAWAELSLKLRRSEGREHAEEIASELVQSGHACPSELRARGSRGNGRRDGSTPTTGMRPSPWSRLPTPRLKR
ncbi:hypothetical protein ACRAWC_21785 [Leifsonia sp. L25]|uniref:hypothetical protein n=1 Tax=Leifsonia sp. L25 TaxID=3423957 RepID=UPI003D692D71